MKSNDHAPKIMERFLSDLDHADCSPAQFDEPPPDLQWNSTGRGGNDARSATGGGSASRSGIEGYGLDRGMSDELSELKPNSQASSDGSLKGLERDSEHRSVDSV